MEAQSKAGPLAGVRIIEFEGIGPAPLAAMILADLGAEVVRIERMSEQDIGIVRPQGFDYALRGRAAAIPVDLKHEQGRAFVLDLIVAADGLLEGFRPGVMERIGLGPEPCFACNPRLVYGRVTGWGQSGPLAGAAGHDLNYLALTGVLDRLGRAGDPPTAPINLLGDYAGGSLLTVIGMLAAILSARGTGAGQVVDAAMIDGVSLLAVPLLGFIEGGIHGESRGRNLLDGGAPHYDVYRCADGKYLSIAPIEARFRKILLEGLGFDPKTFPDVGDVANWLAARSLLTERIASHPRAHWIAIFGEGDACVAPVLDFDEAVDHPHMIARAAHVEIDGRKQPAPAPRFSETPPGLPSGPEERYAATDAVLAEWGVTAQRLADLRQAGAAR